MAISSRSNGCEFWHEGELEIDFPTCELFSPEQERDPVFAQSPKVDVAAYDEDGSSVLLEVKDPSRTTADFDSRADFLVDMMTSTAWQEHNLFHKFDASIRWLHSKRPEREAYDFIALFCLSALIEDHGFSVASLGPLQTRMSQMILAALHPTEVSRTAILTESNWQREYPNYSLTRVVTQP